MKKRRQKIDPAVLIKSVARTMVRVPIEQLALHRTVPEFTHRQGWPRGEMKDGAHAGDAFVGAALSCYAAGAIHQRLRVPAFFRQHPRWDALVRQYGDVVTAAHVVECFSPGELPVGHADRLDSLLGIESKRQVMA